MQAAAGCRQCFRKARAIPGDFVIQGGDHVFDALGVGCTRASSLVDLYKGTEQVRYFTLDGNKLTIRTAEQPSGLFPRKRVVSTLGWERAARQP